MNPAEPHGHGAAQALMERGRALAAPALRTAVDRLAPPMDTVAAYHFGWIDAHGRPTEADSGKAVRPALALLSAEAAGFLVMTVILLRVRLERPLAWGMAACSAMAVLM